MISSQTLIKILNQHDPMKLLSMGAPKDEYKTEVEYILDEINHRQNDIFTLKLVTLLVWEVFTNQFDKYAGPPDNYQSIAEEILDYLQEE